MEQSPRLSLSYVMPAQAQKHVTVNETFRRLDALTQLSVLSRTVGGEPTSPREGDAYILPVRGTGENWQHFSGNNIAVFQDGAWIEISSVAGLRAWLVDEAELAIFDGAVWRLVNAGSATGTEPSPQTMPSFGVNTAADETNRFAVKSDAVLFSHDDVTPGNADCRVTINKANMNNTGSILFQTGFSARAEFGLAGNDDFIIKVSPDGGRWNNAIIVDADNGHVGIGETSPGALFHVGGGGALFGNPSGGDKGNGNINAQGVYDDNTFLSCYVFDQVLDGDIDEVKWDARIPDRYTPPVIEEIEDADGEVVSREIYPAQIEKRQHDPLRKFKARLDGDYDPLTLDGYAKHWREKRHLSAMPNEASFDPAEGLATGEWIQRLVETVEVQAVLIEALNQRLKTVETNRAPKRA